MSVPRSPLRSVCISTFVAVEAPSRVCIYKDEVKLLTNEFKGISTVKTTEQREAILEHKEPGGGNYHVTEWTEGRSLL